jgi:amino acid transporter
MPSQSRFKRPNAEDGETIMPLGEPRVLKMTPAETAGACLQFETSHAPPVPPAVTETTPLTSRPSDDGHRRKLKRWQALALSLGLMAPTLAMAGNAQGLVASVGKAIPLVFFLGLVVVALVAHSFARLTAHHNHSGSAYALVGATVGPRSGLFSGFALLGGYLFFSVATLAALGAFTNAFLDHLQRGAETPMHVPWIVTALVGAALCAHMSNRDSRTITRVLMLLEGIGVVLMMALVAFIFERGGAESTGRDLSTFSLAGVGMPAAAGGVVAAFLSWAGFEACATLGEETDNPRRDIPFAILIAVALTGLLFVMVMFAETIGFGTDSAGLAAFQRSANSLGSLAELYVGRGFAATLVFTAVVSAFACHLSSVAAAGRLLFAFARDGFGPARLAAIEDRHGQPRNGTRAVVAVSVLVDAVCYVTGYPAGSGADPAIDTFFFFGIVGALCLMMVYLLVEVGTIRLILTGGAGIAWWETLFPALGVLALIAVFYFSLAEQSGPLAAPTLAAAWCVLGLAMMWWVPRRAVRTIDRPPAWLALRRSGAR